MEGGGGERGAVLSCFAPSWKHGMKALYYKLS